MLRDDTRIFRLSPNTELISTKTSQLFMLHIEFSSDCHSISMINGLVISLDNKQIVWCLVHNMQSCFSALRFISTVISLNEGISIIFQVHVNRNTRNCIGQEKWANVNTARSCGLELKSFTYIPTLLLLVSLMSSFSWLPSLLLIVSKH